MLTSSFSVKCQRTQLDFLRVKAEFAEVAITKKITSCSFQTEQIRSGTQENINITGPHKTVLTDSLFTRKLHCKSCGTKKKNSVAVRQCQQ